MLTKRGKNAVGIMSVIVEKGFYSENKRWQMETNLFATMFGSLHFFSRLFILCKI